MKTLVTVGEFRDHGGVMTEDKKIWVKSKDGYKIGGDFNEFSSDVSEVTFYKSINQEREHVEQCYVQIEVTPIWK